MLAKDFTYALRTLRKSPIFTATAVATIALGIGASTAIFSVVDTVLLRPLPFKDPQRLVLVCSDMRTRHVRDFPWSNANFFDLRNGTRDVFEDMAVFQSGRQTLPRADGTPEQIIFAATTPNFFRVLGAHIVLGRDFSEADGEPAPAQPPVAAGQQPPPPAVPNRIILSYEFWQRRYGGRRAILGHSLTGGPIANAEVVGVAEPGFEFLTPSQFDQERRPDIWIAARVAYDNAERNSVQWQVVGRLRSGAALQRARAEAENVSAGLRNNFVIEQTAGVHFRVEPLQGYLVDAARPAILALTGAVVFLLLIACANVGNLLLVRASLRERELAVRTAMGGNWWHLARQMLTEALLLAALGAAAGLCLAWAGLQELRAIAPADLPRLDTIRIDPQAVAFAAFAGLAAAALFGLVPALRAARPDVAQVLRSSGRTAGLGGGALLRNAVVVAEVALCFVLLIGSGLMFRSFLALQRIQPGFEPAGLLTFDVLGVFNKSRPQAADRAAIMRQIAERLRAIPGVASASAVTPLALDGGFNPIRWGLAPALADPSKFQAVDNLEVLPGYFETMRTPLLEGRTFTDADNAPNRDGVVIDQVLARKAFGAQSAVGQRLLIRVRSPQPEWVQVLGVVKHVRGRSLAEPGREQIYFADGFLGYGVAFHWVLRTAGNPARYAAAARSAIAGVDRQLLVARVRPMESLMEESRAGTKFSLLLIGVFGVVAVLLAGVGLYGVLATVVRQRTPEIGVRMALGAAPARIFRLVVGHGLQLSLIGVGVGVIAALWLTRAITSMLVGVAPTDPLTFIAMAVLFLAVTALASWVPALRAASLDPNAALRDD